MDFLVNDPGSLDNDLLPPLTNRLFQKDIVRQQNLPFSIGSGSQASGEIVIDYFANGSFGDFTGTADLSSLSLKSLPLSLVWYLGSSDKSGSYPGGGLLPGSFNSSSSVIMGSYVFSGAIASYTVNTTTLTVGITSTNVGWPNLLEAHFYYVIFYDDTGITT